MFNPARFVTPEPKPMPVLLLLDVSGSMGGVKIDTLNEAVRTMLGEFAKAERNETVVKVSIITFGERVERLFPFTSASQIQYRDLGAGGMTPLGTALSMAKAMIEDKNEVPSRAYRPLVVLVSDGQPNQGDWQGPLNAFITDGRSSKCDRMAMAIGSDADRDVLNQFISGTSNPLFEAHRAADISNFFKMVTMTSIQTMQGKGTNERPAFAARPKADVSHSATGPSAQTVQVSLDGATIVSPENQSEDEDTYF